MAAQCLAILRFRDVGSVVDCQGFDLRLGALAGAVLYLFVPWHATVYTAADLLHRHLQHRSGAFPAHARRILPRCIELHHPGVRLEHLRLHHGDFRRGDPQHGPR
ncbi:hypothetical protein D3C75_1008560 [compost metagenome]